MESRKSYQRILCANPQNLAHTSRTLSRTKRDRHKQNKKAPENSYPKV